MRKIYTAHLLSLILAISSITPFSAQSTVVDPELTEQEIRDNYPHAKIIHVSPEEYSQVASTLKHQGYTMDREHSQTLPSNADQIDKNISLAISTDCYESQKQENPDNSGTINTSIDISNNILKSGNNSNSNDAAIIFVIVGTIVIVVWVLYVFKYLFDLSMGFKPCETWYQLSINSSSISDTTDTYYNMKGIRFTSGFREGSTDIGIALEAGKTDILLTEQQALKLDGSYWLLGPTLRWQLSSGYNPYYFHMNFMGGTTSHDETGVIAIATMGLQFGFGKHLYLGINWGAININLHDNPAILTERDQYHFLYGINSGFRF